MNFFLLTFFVVEICLKSFAYGIAFFSEFINLFDSIIVIISYVMLFAKLQFKILGLLRVLRLVKVISGMKKVVDEKRERQEAIKQQKKQSQTMSSYVERVLDFFERLMDNPDLQKDLKEDIQWAIDIISTNKLYAGNMQGFRLQEDRAEVRAWTDLIGLKNIPVNKKEMERLKGLETQKDDEMLSRRKMLTKQLNAQKAGNGNKEHKPPKSPVGGPPPGTSQGGGQLIEKKQTVALEFEQVDIDFLQMVDLADMDQEHLEMATERLEMTTFDAFHFE